MKRDRRNHLFQPDPEHRPAAGGIVPEAAALVGILAVVNPVVRVAALAGAVAASALARMAHLDLAVVAPGQISARQPVPTISWPFL